MFQGVAVSKTLAKYFSELLAVDVSNNDEVVISPAQEEEYMPPVLNAADFSAEISLIPNTCFNYRQIYFRAYYDRKWLEYKEMLKYFKISAISSIHSLRLATLYATLEFLRNIALVGYFAASFMTFSLFHVFN